MSPETGSPRAGKSASRHRKAQTNIRLSDEGRAGLDALSDYWGVSASAVVEQLVRKAVRLEGLKVKGLTR